MKTRLSLQVYARTTPHLILKSLLFKNAKKHKPKNQQV